MLKTDQIESRTYQEVIAASSRDQNTLVVLPTGLGKTIIAVMVASQKLPDGKTLFLAPTKPLVQQHKREFKKFLEIPEDQLQVMTGDTRPAKREKLWQEKQAFFATPQIVENDIISGKIPFEDFSLIIFDEAHRATGDYAYNFISEKTNCQKLALTASPGGDKEKIMEVADNLDINNFEIRTEDDPDVEPYIEDKEVDWKRVSLDNRFQTANKKMEDAKRTQLKELEKAGQLDSINNVQKTDLLNLRGKISSKLSSTDDPKLYSAISHVATALKISQAEELLQTQGVSQAHDYIRGLNNDDSKAAGRALEDQDFQKAKSLIEYLKKKGEEHPKIDKTREILSSIEGEEKAIVFTEYRATAERIIEELEDEGLRPTKFIGQQGDDGMSQTEQIETLGEFDEGKHNVLVSTSLHPEEFIVLKSPRGRIEIREIGEFVDNFLEQAEGDASSKLQEDWRVFTTDGEDTFFKPVTDIHRHKRQNKVISSRLRSAGDFRVTENHSIFSFDQEGHRADKPEEGRFVNLAFEAPSEVEKEEIDIASMIDQEVPKDEREKFFFTFQDLSQPRIREIESNMKFMNFLSSNKSMKAVSEDSGLDPKTVTQVKKRLEKRGLIEVEKGRKKIISKTEKGEEYLEFLNWFNDNQGYYKGKYRIDSEAVANSPEYFRKFCSLELEFDYGKSSVPRYLSVEEIAEFLGYFVSEGHVRNREKGGELLLTRKPDDEIKSKMEKSISQCLQMETDKRDNGVFINSRLPYYLVKYVFRCGTSTEEKCVPPVIFSASEEAKWKFLEAYCEGDGYKSDHRTVFTTISRKLATGLNFLLRQLGVRKISIRKEKRDKENHRDIYRIVVLESLPFNQNGERKGKSTYYDLIPRALEEEEAYEKFGNSYDTGHRMKCRRKGTPNQNSCFDYIQENNEEKNQPDYVYDISVKQTERFFGGTSLACLHNSIGEEGLDIPSVDTVLFYEPVPSAVRDIQRAGRTGRQEEGEVVVLIAEDTRDEGYYWSAHHKKKNMKKTLKELKNSDEIQERQDDLNQRKLDKYNNKDSSEEEEDKDKIEVVADDRENSIAKELSRSDIKVDKQRLDVADFIVSDRTGVERKEAADFVDSIVDNRLFDQIQEIQQFDQPLIIIEGKNLYHHRDISPEAIRGALSSIALDYGTPIIWTQDEDDTAETLKSLAKREQKDKDREVQVRGTKSGMTPEETMEFIVSGIPDINTKIAERLLEEFGTVRKIFTATEEELQEVEGIGQKTADKIVDYVTRSYQ